MGCRRRTLSQRYGTLVRKCLGGATRRNPRRGGAGAGRQGFAIGDPHLRFSGGARFAGSSTASLRLERGRRMPANDWENRAIAGLREDRTRRADKRAGKSAAIVKFTSRTTRKYGDTVEHTSHWRLTRPRSGRRLRIRGRRTPRDTGARQSTLGRTLARWRGVRDGRRHHRRRRNEKN